MCSVIQWTHQWKYKCMWTSVNTFSMFFLHQTVPVWWHVIFYSPVYRMLHLHVVRWCDMTCSASWFVFCLVSSYSCIWTDAMGHNQPVIHQPSHAEALSVCPDPPMVKQSNRPSTKVSSSCDRAAGPWSDCTYSQQGNGFTDKITSLFSQNKMAWLNDNSSCRQLSCSIQFA